MEILYVDSTTYDKNMVMNNFYKDNYIMLKNQNQNTMCGFFLEYKKIMGLCVLVKKDDYIQIVVLHIEKNIQPGIINQYIEYIFTLLKINIIIQLNL